MKSIQTKFVTLILSGILLSNLITGGVGIYSVTQMSQENSAQIMALLCKEKAETINAQLSFVEQTVNSLVEYAKEKADGADKLQNDSVYLEEYTEKMREFAINAANNTEGALAVYLRYSPEFTERSTGLFWGKMQGDDEFHELVATDFSKYDKDDVEHLGWYTIPIENGKPTWIKPYQNQNINFEMISYVVPLVLDGVTVGVVGMDIDFHLIEEIIGSTKVYESGYAFLTDNMANVMYHKKFTKGTPMESTADSLRPVAKALRDGAEGEQLFSYQWEGEKKKMVFSKLRNDMRVVITVPSSEINAMQNQLIMRNMISIMLAALLFVLLTVQQTRKMIKPLGELNTAAQEIGNGNLSVSLSKGADDEIGMLTESFQKTVKHLREYIQYINDLAFRDNLTGVGNKTAYLEATGKLQQKIDLCKAKFAIAVFDLNNLKRVNDTLGYEVGNALIVDSCKIIGNVFRRSPVYRMEGDKFIVILEDNDFENDQELWKRFEAEVCEFNLYARPDASLSIAYGVAIWETQLTVSDVFRQADEKMEQNKAVMKKQLGEGKCT